MKYLITGGAGYIGSTIVSALEDAGHTPIILDSLVAQEAARKRARARRGRKSSTMDDSCQLASNTRSRRQNRRRRPDRRGGVALTHPPPQPYTTGSPARVSLGRVPGQSARSHD